MGIAIGWQAQKWLQHPWADHLNHLGGLELEKFIMEGIKSKAATRQTSGQVWSQLFEPQLATAFFLRTFEAKIYTPMSCVVF